MKEFIGATILAVVLAFALTAVLGPMFINWLHKLKYGQEIREEGPAWHQKKSGTPTMGGIMFIVGIGASVIINIAITAIMNNLTPGILKALILFAVLMVATNVKHIKKLHPIFFILIAGIVGAIFKMGAI